MVPLVVGTCDQSQCPVSQNGKCLEGFSASDITRCPHLLTAEKQEAVVASSVVSGEKTDVSVSTEDLDDIEGKLAEVEVETEEDVDEGVDSTKTMSSTASTSSSMVLLRTGAALSLEEASMVMGSSFTRLIIIAGDSDSGKSTLITCLHEKFSRGEYAGYLFAGSRTLPAFEELCHESRMISERNEPDTARTPRSKGMRFLHLLVREPSLVRPSRQILISNISGEVFEDAKDFEGDARALDFVRRADHFVLLLNGARLADIGSRNTVVTNARMFLRRLLQAQLLGSNSLVDILISKWDLLASSATKQAPNDVDSTAKLIEATEQPSADSSAEEASVDAFLQQVETQFERNFSAQLSRLRFVRVAARPQLKDSMVEGYGLEELFGSWVEEAAPLPIRPQATEDLSLLENLPDHPGCVRASQTYKWETVKTKWRR